MQPETTVHVGRSSGPTPNSIAAKNREIARAPDHPATIPQMAGVSPYRSIKPVTRAGGAGAHGDANADLKRALCNRVGDHGVNARQRKHERDDSECGQQHGREPPWRHRLGNELRHRFHVKDESVLIDVHNSSVYGGKEGQGVTIGSHQQRNRGLRK